MTGDPAGIAGFLYGVVDDRGDCIEWYIDVWPYGADIEPPAAPPATAPVGAVGTQCAARSGPDVSDQADKIMCNSQYDAGKSKAGLAAAFRIDRHGLADMVAEVIEEAFVHKRQKLLSRKLFSNLLQLQYRYIIWRYGALWYSGAVRKKADRVGFPEMSSKNARSMGIDMKKGFIKFATGIDGKDNCTIDQTWKKEIMAFANSKR